MTLIATNKAITAKFPIGARVDAWCVGSGTVVAYTSAYPIVTTLPDTLQHRVVVRLDAPVKMQLPNGQESTLKDMVFAVGLLHPLEEKVDEKVEGPTIAGYLAVIEKEYDKSKASAEAVQAASYNPLVYDTVNFKEYKDSKSAPSGFSIAVNLMCNAVPSPGHPAYCCTLEKGHKGTHAAHGSMHVMATWDSFQDTVNSVANAEVDKMNALINGGSF